MKLTPKANWILAAATVFSARFAFAQAVEMHDVTFEGAGGLELMGTLMTPVEHGPSGSPAILILSDGRSTDRDGNNKPNIVTDLLKQTAERLSTDGFATLRLENRATEDNMKKWPVDPGKFEEFFSWESFVGDAEAAFKFLSEQKGIDPRRVGIFGHGEGAIIAVTVATDPAGKFSPKVLILAGMPGRKLADCVEEQLREHLQKSGKSKEEIDKLLAKNVEIAKSVIENGQIPNDPPRELKLLYPRGLGRYLQKYLPINPATVAAKYTGPVMLIQGEKDTQTSPTLDLPPLEAALKARSSGSVEVFMVKDGSHNLKRVTGPTDPGYSGPVDPDALNKMVNWLRTNLADRN